ncbi:MAG: SMC-Scp complex subunit ScpB [Saccharospirillum sp.]|nr:SMC-Scp complex subunit ScpB [Saccharospirillum sp.]
MTDTENPNQQEQVKPESETEAEQPEVPEAESEQAEGPPASDDEASSLNEPDPAAHDDLTLEATDGNEQAEEGSDEGGDPYGGHSPEHIKQVLEAALFAAGTALSVAQLSALFEPEERPHRRVVRTLVLELMAHYQAGGIQLVEVASGYRFQTRSELGEWVSRLWEERPQRYTRALLETLALIAYRQPITRGEIEDVRGVSVSSSIIKTLQEREWVRVVGHRDVPGRPAMYATTRQFLDYFGLRSLDQLPSLTEIRDLDDIHPELGFDTQTDTESAGGVDSQAEISFSAMVDKLREGEREGKTGNEFIDNQLDSQLQEMDAVNEAIEQAFEAQRAGHNQPGLELSDEDDGSEASGSEGTSETGVSTAQDHQTQTPQNQPTTEDEPVAEEAQDDEPESELDEAERWRIIQEKLAQQQALLDARESDPSGGDDTEND